MNRYKEALSEQDFKRYKNMNLHSKLMLLHNGVDSTAIKILCLNDLEQALTTPTSEEVCKALSDYLKKKIVFKNNKFYGYYSIINNFSESEYEKEIIGFYDDDIYISIALPPHLITLIGRFYEGVIENER